MPKESLSIIAVKTILAIAIFTGVGTIIIGGGYLIGKQGKVSEPVKENIVITDDKTKKSVPVSQSVKDSLVIFEKKGKIFLLDGLNSQPREIAEGNNPSLSPDGAKIAFVKMDKDNNIHIYEVKTGKTETLTTNEWRLRRVSWSLNGKYLITESGTGVAGGGSVYEYPAGRKITSFSAYGIIKWINNEEFIFQEHQQVSPPRPYGGGEGSGLSKITLPSGTKQVLAQSVSLENFNLLKAENGIIYFSKTTVESSDDWGQSISAKEDVSYWQMNSNGGERIKIPKPEILKERIVKELPEEFSGYHIFFGPVSHPLNNNWVIFDINKEGSIYNDPICIMNLNNPKNSFKQIATGSYPSWGKAKDETADWKTYRNEEYGFEFKHPLICNTIENKKSRIISFGGDEDLYLHKDPYICPPMYIVVQDNPNKLSVQDWLQRKYPNSYLNKESDSVFIEGEIKGIKTKVKSEKDIYGFVAWLNNNEYIYEIEWSEATDNTSFKNFEKILSSFKFIEK